MGVFVRFRPAMSPVRTFSRPGRAGLRVRVRRPASGPAPSAPAATDDGGTTLGHWSHAFTAFGVPPKYPRGFKAFDWVNPDAPKGGTIYLGNPDRRTSFDKFNPYTLKGSPPDRRADPHVRAARHALGRRARHGLRSGGGRDARAGGQVVDQLSHQSQGALQQRGSGHGRGRQAFLRHADEQGRRAVGTREPRGRLRRRHRRRPHRAGGPQGAHRRHDLQRHRDRRVLPQVGRRGRTASRSRSTKSSTSTRSRPVPMSSRAPTRDEASR